VARRSGRLLDVQEMSAPEMIVYEAVAALGMEGRPATVCAVARMTGLPEPVVGHGLDGLVAGGRVRRAGGGYVLGPHDWDLER